MEKYLTKIILGIPLKNYIITLGIILVFGIIQIITGFIIKKKFDIENENNKNSFMAKSYNAILNYIFLSGFFFGAKFINFGNLWNNRILSTIEALFILNTGYLVFKITGYLLNLIVPLVEKTRFSVDNDILSFIKKSLRFFIVLVTAAIILDNYMKFSPEFSRIINKVILSLFTLNVVYVFFKMTDSLIKYLMPLVEKTESKLDDQLIPVLSKLIKIIIIIVGILSLLKNMGYDISAIIAGLGIGGLAIALAAQDTIANFFGSIIIFLDQPFQIDDRIVVNGNDGVVIYVGLRSTVIKTLQGTQIIIPNKEIANSSIENISRIPARKVVADLGLVYSTPVEKINLAKQLVSDILTKHEKVDELFYVYFSDFRDFSLNIKLIFWITELDYKIFTEILHELNLVIKKEFEKNSLEFAFPTQTIFFNNETETVKEK